MDRPKAPNLRRLGLIGVVFIILTTVLLFWARDIVREVVVLPLSYLFWVIGILVELTPQIYFWIVVLVIAFMIAYPSLSRKKKKIAGLPPISYVEQPDPDTTGRSLYWLNKVNLMRSGRSGYHSHVFQNAFVRLLVDMLAYRYRLSTGQVEDGLRDGSLNLPADVRDYALEGLNPLDIPQGSYFAWIWSQFVATVRSELARLQDSYWNRTHPTGASGLGGQSMLEASNGNRRGPRDDPRVKRIVQYMEEELEVLHDDTGR